MKNILTQEEKVLVTLFFVLLLGAPVWGFLVLYVAGAAIGLSDLVGLDWHGFLWRNY